MSLVWHVWHKHIAPASKMDCTVHPCLGASSKQLNFYVSLAAYLYTQQDHVQGVEVTYNMQE